MLKISVTLLEPHVKTILKALVAAGADETLIQFIAVQYRSAKMEDRLAKLSNGLTKAKKGTRNVEAKT